MNDIICGWNLFLLLIKNLSLVHFKWPKGEADINKFIIYIKKKNNNMKKKQYGLLWYFVTPQSSSSYTLVGLNMKF